MIVYKRWDLGFIKKKFWANNFKPYLYRFMAMLRYPIAPSVKYQETVP